MEGGEEEGSVGSPCAVLRLVPRREAEDMVCGLEAYFGGNLACGATQVPYISYFSVGNNYYLKF